MKTEYKVVPAPERAATQRGLKGAALFAHEMERLMNELAADGWQYLRSDTLPQEERSGLTNKITTYRNLLVFQRVTEEKVAQEPAPEPARQRVGTPPEVDCEDDIINLWESSDAPPAKGPLVAQRQGKRVDL